MAMQDMPDDHQLGRLLKAFSLPAAPASSVRRPQSCKKLDANRKGNGKSCSNSRLLLAQVSSPANRWRRWSRAFGGGGTLPEHLEEGEEYPKKLDDIPKAVDELATLWWVRVRNIWTFVFNLTKSGLEPDLASVF